MLLVRNIRLPLAGTEEQAVATACKRLGLAPAQVAQHGVSKLSVDARHGKPVMVYTVALALQEAGQEETLAAEGKASRVQTPALVLQPGQKKLPHPPIVCGLGPAGLFCALVLARQGLRPVVLERGAALEERTRAVTRFFDTGVLDTRTNVQFGEGGAGAFSDGKLTTRIGDALCGWVTQVLLAHGAPPEIAWQQKPHVGTDLLCDVVVSIRHEIETLGGRVLFGTQLTGLVQQNGRVQAVRTTAGEIPCEALVLAVGHSARDTFAMLLEQQLPLVCKPFSVGVRAEHLQAEIDRGLYHEAAGHPALPPGEYQLSQQLGGRGVYTFCMCPGGQVVAAASEEGGVVTNGMSYHARDGKNANAAVVVGVGSADFDGQPLRAIAFQRQLEQAAFAAGGGDYRAPAETLGSFLEGRGQLELQRVQPSYSRGVVAGNLGALLPEELAEALRGGLRAFGRKLPGYAAPDTVLTGLETRTSSPVRLERDETFQAQALRGLYPCGEGAGYAGGIMSAAVDGVRVARSIVQEYTAQ